MGNIGYYIALPVLYGLSILPFWLMYRVSDVGYLFVYHIFGYRKAITRKNLKNAFPEKSDAERLAIERKFYRYFCDLVLETIKTLTIPTEKLRQRVTFEGEENIRPLLERGQSVVVAMGHFGNWEFAGAGYNNCGLHHINVIYHPLSNTKFDKLICHMRTRHGTGLYPMKQVGECLARDKDKTAATVFITDQAPRPEKAYWTTFLNQDTAVFFGIEKYALEYDYPVVYLSIPRIKRGHYKMRFEVLVEEPRETTSYEITEAHVKRLEQDVRRQPEIWLWTHRRWKHEKPYKGVV